MSLWYLTLQARSCVGHVWQWNLTGDVEKHSKNEPLLADWSTDWHLYWMIIKSALLRHEGSYIRSNSMWGSSIFTLGFFFICKSLRLRKKKKKTHNKNKRINDVHAMNQWLLKLRKCATVNRELGWVHFHRVSRGNTAIYGHVWELRGSDYIIILKAMMCFSKMLRLRQRDVGLDCWFEIQKWKENK